MKFRLETDIPSYPFRIAPDMPGLVIGSCFAGHIGSWLSGGKLPVAVNPFGVLYNPASIGKALDRLWEGVPFTGAELFRHNGLWHSFAHHGSFSGSSKEETLHRINTALRQGTERLKQAQYLILTLGTAWVYEKAGEVAANCHKLPAREFVRRRMGVGEIVSLLERQIGRFPGKKFLLTVSPVIHRGDGLMENQRSKALLLVAVAELTEKYPEQVFYFPAYEILTGELRDYRFYGEDMCHPAPLAVEYIRERFAGALLTGEACELIAASQELRRGMEHRPLHADSPEYERFRSKMLQKAKALQQKYKNADFSEELSFFG